jgi:hypothetical protein
MAMDRLCAHALAGSCCGLGLQPETRNRASPCLTVWTACGFGAKAFSANTFNANIGAWNTASVYTMQGVCAAPGPAARTMADALGRGFDAARPVVRGGTADTRAHVRTRASTRLRGALGVGTAARRGGSIHASEYIHIFVRLCYKRYVHTLSIYLYM